MTFRILCSLSFFGFALSAQTLTIGSATSQPGATTRLPVTLSGATSDLTAVQWDMNHGHLKVTVSPGPAASAASKTLMCAALKTGFTRCILVGVNNAVANGIVAFIDVSASTTSAGIEFTRILGVGPGAKAVPFSGVAGTVSQEKVPAPTRPPIASKARFNGQIQCGLKALRNVGDKLTCVCYLPPEERGAGWYSPFTSSEGLVKASAQVWVEAGQASFDFRVELIEDPKVTGPAILLVGTNRKDRTYSGIIHLMPPGGTQ